MHALLQRARAEQVVVFHVQNDGAPGEADEPCTPGWELAVQPIEGEGVFRKRHDDAFVDTDLAAELRARGVERLVVAGTLSDYCVRATARGALRNGCEVVLASGAHATYDDRQSAAALAASVEAELEQEGVRVERADEIGFGEISQARSR